jgi:hypothetical protein
MRLIYVVMLVGCGSESSSPDAFVPFDADFRVSDMDITIHCEP